MTEPPARIYYLTFAKKISIDDLQRSFFVPEGFPQPLNVLLLVVYLLHGLAQVGLKFVVGVCRFRDALLEGHVGVVPVRPHFIGALGDQIIHLAPEPLTGRPRSLKKKIILDKVCHQVLH